MSTVSNDTVFDSFLLSKTLKPSLHETSLEDWAGLGFDNTAFLGFNFGLFLLGGPTTFLEKQGTLIALDHFLSEKWQFSVFKVTLSLKLQTEILKKFQNGASSQKRLESWFGRIFLGKEKKIPFYLLEQRKK